MKKLILSIVAIAALTATSAFADVSCKSFNELKGYKSKSISEIKGSAQAYDQMSGGLSSSATQIFGDVGVSKKINTFQVFQNYGNLWSYAKEKGKYKEFTQKFFIFETARMPKEEIQNNFDEGYYSSVQNYKQEYRKMIKENLDKNRDGQLKAGISNLFFTSPLSNFDNFAQRQFFDLVIFNKTGLYENESLRDRTTTSFLGDLIDGRIKEAYEIIMNINNSKEFSGAYKTWKESCK